MSELPGTIAAIAGRRDAMEQRLVRWAEINSGSSNSAGLARMAEALMSEFAAEFPQAVVEAIPLAAPVDAASRRVGSGGDAASTLHAISVRRRPEAALQILLSGHYDTVYAAGHSFQRCRRIGPDILNGPGVADMKGGIVVMLEVLRAIEADPNRDRIGWQVLLTPDEETGSVLSASMLLAAAGKHRLALVFEPSRPNGNIVRARMGTGILTAICRGRAAHAGRAPEQGRNAIVALSEFLTSAHEAARTIPGVLFNIGSIRGGGTLNIVPDFAEAGMNFRVSQKAGEAALRKALDEAAARVNAREGYRLEISGQLNRPPKEIIAGEEALFAFYRRCAGRIGVEVDWQDVAGGSDGNFLAAAGLPCLDGIGPIGDHLHSPEEVVNLPSLVSRAQTAALFLGERAAAVSG